MAQTGQVSGLVSDITQHGTFAASVPGPGRGGAGRDGGWTANLHLLKHTKRREAYNRRKGEYYRGALGICASNMLELQVIAGDNKYVVCLISLAKLLHLIGKLVESRWFLNTF